MSELKPVIEWLNELPDEYRERAIAQCVDPKLKCERFCAITEFSNWEATNEGAGFWWVVDDAFCDPNHYSYPPLPDDGGPGCKPKRDLRYVAEITGCSWYLVEKNSGDAVVESAYLYHDRSTAKRGLIRFLKRLGVDETAVRWEGE